MKRYTPNKKNQPHNANEKNNAHPKSSEETHCKQKAKARRKWKGNNLRVRINLSVKAWNWVVSSSSRAFIENKMLSVKDLSSSSENESAETTLNDDLPQGSERDIIEY